MSITKCNLLFRECAAPIEFYEYGIWMPRDEFRAASDAPPPSSSTSSKGNANGNAKGNAKGNARGDAEGDAEDSNDPAVIQARQQNAEAEKQKAEEQQRKAEEEQRKAEEEAARKAEEERVLAEIQAQKAKYESKFKAVSGGKDECSPDNAGVLSRQMGYAPTQEDLRQLKELHGENLTFDQVMDFMTSQKQMDTTDELVEAFAAYDTNNDGTLSRAQMVNLLNTFGEPMTLEEINAVLQATGMEGDPVDYRKFCDIILEKDPEE
ncbi:MAG: uncharacterized protein KVP18_001715 [Porospora cf. gigantea A]|uniref:uncharacterized protein n=1 Tax=Porospora cf. gigantea A TaxID=2853593 RepID=UPI003559C547|nr:MAG: hypothetical protein KVP18_001715 [Porospora cf. gigantea A]